MRVMFKAIDKQKTGQISVKNLRELLLNKQFNISEEKFVEVLKGEGANLDENSVINYEHFLNNWRLSLNIKF